MITDRILPSLCIVIAVAIVGAPIGAADADSAQQVMIAPEFVPAFGGGTQPTFPREMVVFDGRLVVYGPLTGAGNVAVVDGPAAWDGSAFAVNGMPTEIDSRSQTVFNGMLTYGDATWDGQTLQLLRGTEAFSIVRARLSKAGPSGLLAAARIEVSPTDTHDELILWDGTQWQRIVLFAGAGTAVAEFEGAYFLGGPGVTTGDLEVFQCLRWDGAWTAYPELQTVNDFVIVGSDLYAATANGLHVWNGSGGLSFPGPRAIDSAMFSRGTAESQWEDRSWPDSPVRLRATWHTGTD